MKIFIVHYSYIYMMCETFFSFDSAYKNKEDAELRLKQLNKNGDEEAYIEEEDLK